MQNVPFRSQNWVFSAKKNLQGIRTGGDFCAEHEIGMKPILEAFGVDLSLEGLERHRIQSIPDTLHWVETSDYAGMVYQDFFIQSPEKTAEGYQRRARSGEPVIAWTDDSFLILAPKSDKLHARAVKALWEAIQAKNLYLGGSFSDKFGGGGIGFFITTKMPDDEMRNADAQIREDAETQRHLERAVAKEKFWKVERELRDKGHQWFYLRPKTVLKDGKVGYWLNPCDQANNYFGMVTIDDLKDWLKGSGKIPGGGRAQRA